MADVPPLPHRRTIRFQGFDYFQAACYFVTICAHGRRFLFGGICGGYVRLNVVGKIVEECLKEIALHFGHVEVPVCVVMPNHLHGILVLRERARRAVPLLKWSECAEGFGEPVGGSVPTIIRSFKSAVSRRARMTLRNPSLEIWQRNYFERVIRTQDEFRKTWDYICENPAR